DSTEALKGGNSGPVIKPGDASHSRLLLLVAGLDPPFWVPPAGKRALTAQEKATHRARVEQGGKGPAASAAPPKSRPQTQNWAFQPCRRSSIPTVSNPNWLRNEIDAFILARLDTERIAPSPEADRMTLIRRLSLDLRGLPPTPEEIDAFGKDTKPGAYERLVN